MSQVVTKTAASVAPVAEPASPNGEFDVILSTNAVDRDGDSLEPSVWKQPLPDHITFDADHGMSVTTTVGSGRPFINDAGKIQVRGSYANTELGQLVRELVNDGHIRSTSVAFLSYEGEDGTVERELLNGAFVAVPANPEAIVLASKSADLDDDADQADEGVETSDDDEQSDGDDVAETKSTDEHVETKAVDPTERIQAVHDAAVHLGAGCPSSVIANNPRQTNPAAAQSSPGVQSGLPKTVKTPNPDGVGEPQVTADAAAPTAEQAADSTAKTEAAVLRAKALSFLIESNTKE